MFYDKYVSLCAQKGVTPSAAAKEIGINKAAVSNWKHRRNGPSDITVQKIADYFGVTVDELLTEDGSTSALMGKGILAKKWRDGIHLCVFGIKSTKIAPISCTTLCRHGNTLLRT